MASDEKILQYMAAFDLAVDSPEKGLPRLWELLEAARRIGDIDALHSLGDVLLPLLIHHRSELEKAESLAHELVALLPDSIHLVALAQVYEAQGRESDAAETMARARTAKDEHTDESSRKIIEQVAAEYAAASSDTKKPVG